MTKTATLKGSKRHCIFLKEMQTYVREYIIDVGI